MKRDDFPTIRFGSVCSGIEAASVAWAPLGWEASWLAEIEKFPCAVLAHHYPTVPNLGDMTKIASLIRDGFVPTVDLLCGGTPCQAFSIAGLRNSLDDDRGNLTLVFCEIADENDARRKAAGLLPAVIVWENVPGVLTTKDNAFGCFLAGLAGEDCALVAPRGKWPNAGAVYGPKRAVAWRVIDAQYFGLAQRRKRVIVVASAREGFDPATVLFEFDGVRRDSAPSREAGQDTAGTLASRTDGGGFPGTDEACSGYVQPICPTLRAGGNRTGGDRPPGTDVDTADSLIAVGGFQRPGVTCNHEAPIAFDSRQDPVSSTEVFGALGSSSPQAQAVTYPIQNALRGKDQNGLGIGEAGAPMYTLDQGSQHGVCSVALRGREGGATAELGDDLACCLRASGGGGDKPHVLAPVCITGDITHTLKAEGFDASENGTGRGQPIVAASREVAQCLTSNYGKQLDNSDTALGPNVAIHGMAVRRLTPVECERLQGFPDGYTFIPTWNGWRPMDAGETPESCAAEGLEVRQNKKSGKWRVKDVDGPRYKALGNSWAVHKMRWVGGRIDRQLRANFVHESQIARVA